MCGIVPLISSYFSKAPIYGSPPATSSSAVHAEVRQESCKNTCSLFHVTMSTLFLESRETCSKTLQHISRYLQHPSHLTTVPLNPQSNHRGSGHSIGCLKRTCWGCWASARSPSLCPGPEKMKTKTSQAEMLVANGCRWRITERCCLPGKRSKELVFQFSCKTKQERSARGKICLK